MREPKLSRIFWIGIFIMIIGLIFVGAGLPFAQTVAMACVGCGLAPLGFLISFICFLVWRKNKKEYVRRLISEQNRKERENKAKKARAAAFAKIETDRKAKEANRKRSGIIWTSKAERMSSLLFEYVELTEKGYSLNSKQINELGAVHHYVKRDYEWFKAKKEKAPTIEWDTLDNNMEAVEVLIEK